MGRLMENTRTKQRRRVLKSGKIGFNGGGAIDCVIRDMSERGACLKVASPVGVPDAFELVLDDNGYSRPCRVKWRKATQIGVEFC